MFQEPRSTSFFDYLRIQFEFVQDFLAWWFIDIPNYMIQFIRRVNTVINDTTSFGILVRGYLSPWKNDNNIAGWLVGLILKTAYLPVIFIFILLVNAVLLALFIVQLAILPLVLTMLLISPFMPL